MQSSKGHTNVECSEKTLYNSTRTHPFQVLYKPPPRPPDSLLYQEKSAHPGSVRPVRPTVLLLTQNRHISYRAPAFVVHSRRVTTQPPTLHKSRLSKANSSMMRFSTNTLRTLFCPRQKEKLTNGEQHERQRGVERITCQSLCIHENEKTR